MIQELVEDVEQSLVPAELVVDLRHVRGQQLAGRVGVSAGHSKQRSHIGPWPGERQEARDRPSGDGESPHDKLGAATLTAHFKATLSPAAHHLLGVCFVGVWVYF